MGRTIILALGLILGGVFSQAPEFAQQYRQRLGGAIDELKQVVADFNADAEREGLKTDDALKRLSDNPDTLASRRGERMTQIIARYHRLERQQDAMQSAGPVNRIVALARDFDGEVAEGAYEDYEPAVPVTIEGLLAALVGFVLAYFGGGVVWSANRWRRKRRARRKAEATERAA
ncbi:DUF2937 family protein [Rhodobium gokarnense]|uniref:DUF2937 family protein n=1 Tax=Rhodobium gokarnense TaxID=364296 RepID=A0ABT3H6M5_9HYPH|nr:DUF2937 family protein [Rhodobium gokarnense]MCW2306038.1 hypothetical protein [Rhodobium gokarnense]